MKWRSMLTQSYINVINAPKLSPLLRAFSYTVAECTKPIQRIITSTNSTRPDTDKLMKWILKKELRVILEGVTVPWTKGIMKTPHVHSVPCRSGTMVLGYDVINV